MMKNYAVCFNNESREKIIVYTQMLVDRKQLRDDVCIQGFFEGTSLQGKKMENRKVRERFRD